MKCRRWARWGLRSSVEKLAQKGKKGGWGISNGARHQERLRGTKSNGPIVRGQKSQQPRGIELRQARGECIALGELLVPAPQPVAGGTRAESGSQSANTHVRPGFDGLGERQRWGVLVRDFDKRGQARRTDGQIRSSNRRVMEVGQSARDGRRNEAVKVLRKGARWLGVPSGGLDDGSKVRFGET